MKRTNVYIDGFNFYYGCIRGTPYRWLDLGTFCQAVFPHNQINHIRYFTALVKPTPEDPTQPQRQLTYLRALRTIPNLSIHLGRFSVTTKRRWLAHPPAGAVSRSVDIIHVEEKGSDVNLASHLLMDGFDGDYEVAVVVSNDSDLLEPIRMVRGKLGLTVGILNPYRKTAVDLRGEADFYRSVRHSALGSCQFPPVVFDAHGMISKPAEW